MAQRYAGLRCVSRRKIEWLLITEEKMAERIGVSSAIEMQIANLRAKGILIREGADFGGYWRILTNPQTKQ